MTKLLTILALLLALGASLSLSTHQAETYLRQMKLTFNYAARQNVALESNSFSVEWNGKAILQVEPKDYNINSASKVVQAEVGSNLISFIAKGTSDSLGVTIDNIELIRTFSQTDKEYFIVNGGFEKGHRIGSGGRIFSGNFKGWEDNTVEVGNGKNYNRNWEEGNHVAELDQNKNGYIWQEFCFDKYYHWIDCPDDIIFKSEKLKLTFDYAARIGQNLTTCGIKALWNGNIVAEIKPSGYSIGQFTAYVQTKSGDNKLQFMGGGDSDSVGATISNVELWGGQKNYIVNGDFSQPVVQRRVQTLKTIPGWQGDEIEIGLGSYYNEAAWRSRATQVVELDVSKNENLEQIIKF